MWKSVLVAAIIGWVGGQEFECPTDENLQCVDGNYPYENSCVWYYQCADCQYAIKECDSGFHFDESLGWCRDPYLAECDPAYARNGSAYCVYFDDTDGTLTGAINPLKYTKTLVNYKSPYDPVNGYWRAAHTGHFFFHMSAGGYPSERINITTAGTPFAWNLVRNSQHHQYDVISRDIIMKLSERFTTAHTLPDFTALGNRAGKPTMWAGFEIEEFNDLTVAFYSVSNTYQDAGTTNTIQFEDEMLDVQGTNEDANNFNQATGVFTAPYAGHYFFMFSTAMSATAEHRSRFFDGSTFVTELYRGVGINDGIDTISKSCIHLLAAGDTMEMQLLAGEVSNNQSTLLAFGGFYINPKPPTPVNIWYVTSDVIHTGPEDPMTYDNVGVNMGGLFNPADSVVTIQSNGYYYISMYSGVNAADPIDLQLIHLNGTQSGMLVDVYRSDSYQNNIDTLGRSVLVHMKAGDTVHIRLESGSTSYSDGAHLTTFSGFLLFDKDEP